MPAVSKFPGIPLIEICEIPSTPHNFTAHILVIVCLLTRPVPQPNAQLFEPSPPIRSLVPTDPHRIKDYEAKGFIFTGLYHLASGGYDIR